MFSLIITYDFQACASHYSDMCKLVGAEASEMLMVCNGLYHFRLMVFLFLVKSRHRLSKIIGPVVAVIINNALDHSKHNFDENCGKLETFSMS